MVGICGNYSAYCHYPIDSATSESFRKFFLMFAVFLYEKFCALFQRICFISQKQRKSFVLYCDNKVTRLLFFLKSSFSEKFPSDGYRIFSFWNQNWMFLRMPKKYENRVAYLDNLTYSSCLLHFTLRFLAAVVYNKIER